MKRGRQWQDARRREVLQLDTPEEQHAAYLEALRFDPDQTHITILEFLEE